MLHQVDAVPALALGEGAIRAVPAEAARLAPGAAVLAVVDPALADGPLASGLVQGLAEAGLRPRLHAPPPGEPKADGIAEAADAARAAGAGLILGFGGGSAVILARSSAEPPPKPRISPAPAARAASAASA
ncbi:MAG: iron-containing alcohol dehydrogenase, partial [Pseudomonadota bacterium]